MKKRILSALLIFTMATTIIPIHAETKLPAGYVQMAKNNPKISGDSEYYTHVKYYSEPITIVARNQLKRIKDNFSNPNYQNACGSYTEKLCQNTPFSRNLSLLELTIGSIYKNYKKIPRLSCKSGVFSWTFFYRPRKSYIVCIRVSRLQCIDIYNYLDQYIMRLCIA